MDRPSREDTPSRDSEPGGTARAVGLDYDEAVRVLRRRLVSSHATASAASSRAGRQDGEVSGRTWSEIAEIDALLVLQLETALTRELRATPWPGLSRARAFYAGIYRGFRGERDLALQLFEEARDEPVGAWRARAPQLEASLWPFWEDRNHFVANSLALALSEPAPFPAVIWISRERRFRRA